MLSIYIRFHRSSFKTFKKKSHRLISEIKFDRILNDKTIIYENSYMIIIYLLTTYIQFLQSEGKALYMKYEH